MAATTLEISTSAILYCKFKEKNRQKWESDLPCKTSEELQNLSANKFTSILKLLSNVPEELYSTFLFLTLLVHSCTSQLEAIFRTTQHSKLQWRTHKALVFRRHFRFCSTFVIFLENQTLCLGRICYL